MKNDFTTALDTVASELMAASDLIGQFYTTIASIPEDTSHRDTSVATADSINATLDTIYGSLLKSRSVSL